ncbi:N-acetylglucosamine-6-phosphate deacetylase [Cryobacterium suzukii]|uniref:N-acetylglucosamine-6-phosphate deacetylase n=1 Tax=Cryobacterium suzukii TaxID=1259198 RepID=A0A4R9AF86_9MICO|nr:amidohydrolase family protein [Cryobacterium suzukii]TFD59788.1 N-acetylglucosamine-6-phosphate deacetylase [Cryobacterium suzukii]
MQADSAAGFPDAPVRVLRGRLITGRLGEDAIEDGAVWLEGGRIRWCGRAVDLPAGINSPVERVPLILPGLVDVHCHGGRGHTFASDLDGAYVAANYHAAHGTTSILASLVAAPSPVLLKQITVLRALVQDGTLAGLHLEGPFLAESMCGAQDPAAIIDGNPALLEQWLQAGQGAVTSITLAPETPHFAELVSLCRDYDVVPSLGHTAATAAQTRNALASMPPEDTRAWSATHLFNRMPPLGHRVPGPVAVLLQAAQRTPDRMILELIADGVHLDPEIVRMVFALVGPQSIALISDAMAATGMNDGAYSLGSLDVIVHGGIARLIPADRNTRGAIAGGTSTLLENVRHCVEWGIPLIDAVAAASSTPARLMGFTGRGSITAGYRADLLVTTENLELLQAYRAGIPLKIERTDRADYPV